MKLEFQWVNEGHVKIIAVDGKGEAHEVGEMFTPGGTGHKYLNVVQICGFTEAFDLWGCANYIKPKLKDGVVLTDKQENVKDIQLKFDLEVINGEHNGECCWGCYNNPCTCESKEKYTNPYTIKRAQDLNLIKKDKNKKGFKLEF